MADETLDAAHWFEGLDPEKQAQWQQEARERWGADTVDASVRRVKDKPKDWWQREGSQWLSILHAMVAMIDAGKAPDDPDVLDAVHGHYEWICQFWTPNRESYTGLGDLYAQDPRFRANYDKTDPRLAEFMRAAMKAYAQARLA